MLALAPLIAAMTACGTLPDPQEPSPTSSPTYGIEKLRGIDIGEVRHAGTHEADGDGARVRGSGHDIWGTSDGFFYAYWQVEGDFEFTARVASMNAADAWAKAGLMMRATERPDSPNAMIAVTADGRVTFQVRETTGGTTVSTRHDDAGAPTWIRLARQDGETRAFYSHDKTTWTPVDTSRLAMPTSFRLGLAVTAHDADAVTEALFEDVTLETHPEVVEPDHEEGDSEGSSPEEGDPEGSSPEEGDPEGSSPEEGDSEESSPVVDDSEGSNPEEDASEGPDGVIANPTSQVGLHVTEEELAIWRNRAQNGPYRTAGDAGPNTPGDWQRITGKADTFLADPGWRRWHGNTTSSCYQWGDPAPDNEPSTNLRDAAFVYLITGDTRYRDAARDELLALADEPGLDLADTTRWCTGKLRDGNPALEIGNWFSHLLIAYDYLGDDSFTPDQRATLDMWFRTAGHFFKDEIHHDLSKNFVDRLSDDYRLTDYAKSANSFTTTTSHYGGHEIYSLARFYNNRRATSVRFFGLVGVKLDDPELKNHAKRFVHEFLTYSTFEDGVVGDFERWLDRLPDLGWDYAAASLSSIITLADAFARTGDTSLYDYSTTDGAYGTQSATPKTLLLAIQNHQSYLLPATHRYGTDSSSHEGDPDYRIDGSHAPADWYSIADITLLPANTYYQDPAITAIYTRTHPDTDPYPHRPAPRGHAPAWNGDWGLYPGILLMYGQTEGTVAF